METSEEREQEQARQYSRIIAKVWLDERFKQQLINDLATVLAAEGITLPPGADIRVLESSAEVAYFVLPARPADDEISDADLEQVAGGHVGLAQYYREIA